MPSTADGLLGDSCRVGSPGAVAPLAIAEADGRPALPIRSTSRLRMYEAPISSIGLLSPSYRHIVSVHREFVGAVKECSMTKERQSNKEAKKQALKTPKEKKAAKQAKKHASDIVPIIAR
jgi:hypothetical protein